MKSKSIILLSGGLDSTVSATIAKRRTDPLFALTVDYGQRSARMEIRASGRICKELRIHHKTVRLPFFTEFKKCALISSNRIAGKDKFNRVEDVWVPNRNGLLINIAACYAEYYGARLIITGFNREEAREFPDNTARFIMAMNRALQYSTLKHIRVKSFVSAYTKKQIYALGIRYQAPLRHVYSCYLGTPKMCGQCASCQKLRACLQQ